MWNCRGGHQNVYQYDENRDKDRMGDCSWLPKHGDLCVRVADSGDCFHNYVAIRRENGKYKKVGKFGAYIFGKKICKLKDRTYHLILAGEEIEL